MLWTVSLRRIGIVEMHVFADPGAFLLKLYDGAG